MSKDVQKNWFGMDIHPSDCLINQRDKDEGDAFKDIVKQVRADWDLLVSNSDQAMALDRLIEKQYDIAFDDIHDDDKA